jgi:alkylation response protein AidB-like acyl-CoA dehydrogenase
VVSDLVDEVRTWLAMNWSLDLTVREWWRRLSEAGFAHPTWPWGVGGRGLSASDARTITAELARAKVVAPPIGHLGATLAAPTILAHGTGDQVVRFVGEIARGEAAWCQLFSEPGAGSDLAGLATRAVLDGERWMVNGQKVWNSSADAAQYGMLLARTDLDASKHQGITYLLIDMEQPGVDVRPLRTMSGATTFCEVFLTDAVVQADRVLGDLNDGWRVARTTTAAERAMVVNRIATGLAPARSGPRAGDLDRTVAAVIARASTATRPVIPGGAVPTALMMDLARRYGGADDPVLRQRLAAYYIQNRVNGWTSRRIAAGGGRLTGADGSLTKLAISRISQVSRDLSMAIVGAEGMLADIDSPLDGELVRVALASPGIRIGGGTDEIQLNLIGERGLGLPKEPSGDRGEASGSRMSSLAGGQGPR